MPNLIIDNRAVEVTTGTRVIDAAEQLGIMIPRFCYLKVLGAVGACRMCAVHFIAGPVKGVEMSCMVEARDGMVVSTTDPEAVNFRRQVIEWLMANHPHDCPVCDEGGQCLLQDETVAGGHAIRRYPGRKRTYLDQYLGPFIQQEMNRCIHCYRCARFYKEYAGYRDFGVLQIGNRIFYGRFTAGPLESPFSGNLVDICPTGVFTDKPARYRARRWDMQRAPSVCIHCGVGCSTTVNGFHQEIIRQEARENRLVNGSFICDRGRFGCFYANHPERPWRPRLKNGDTDWGQALEEAATQLEKIVGASGPQAVAFLGSERNSLETMVMLEQAGRRLGTGPPLFFTDPRLEYRVKRARARLGGQSAISLAEVENSDCILVAGVDPIHEAPMLALALRQAARKGAAVAVLDPRPVSLPLDFTLLAAAPAEIPGMCAALVCRAFDQQAAGTLDEDARRFYDSLASGKASATASAEMLSGIVEEIAECRRPVIICGTGIVHNSLPDFTANLARLLCGIKGYCGLYYVFPGPNDLGAVLLSRDGTKSFPGLLEAIENNELRALIVAEADPFHSFCDRKRLETALAKLELLVCLDYLPTQAAARAHVLFPTSTHFETGSHFINQEARLQYAEAVHASSRPLSQVTAGKHPPRDYGWHGDAPGPQPAWQVLQDLCDRVTGQKEQADIQALLQQLHPGCSEQAGLLLQKQAGAAYHFPVPASREAAREPGAMELILTAWTFGTEELSSYSAPAAGVKSEPHVMMHVEDAARGGLNDGDMVILHLDRGILQLRLQTSAGMARGCVVLPRHRDLEWQQLKYQQGMLPLCRIERA